MHEPVAQTGKWLKSVVQGYFNYHAVPGNTDSLRVFRFRVTRLWRQVLIRRGQRASPELGANAPTGGPVDPRVRAFSILTPSSL